MEEGLRKRTEDIFTVIKVDSNQLRSALHLLDPPLHNTVTTGDKGERVL